MKRDSFVFYRSFFEATEPLNKEQKAELFDAICSFALNKEEIELSPISKAMFALIKPQLEANYKKFLNGKAPKRNQTKSKIKAKQKQNKSKITTNVNDNDNVNVNVNKNVYGEKEIVKLLPTEFKKLEDKYKLSDINNCILSLENYIVNTKK